MNPFSTLFYLAPWNEKAKRVISNPANRRLVCHDIGSPALAIGSHIPLRSDGIIATLGREGTDIYIPGRSIDKVQYHFEIDFGTGVVKLVDRSAQQSTQTFESDTAQFHSGAPRQVVVHPASDTIIGMGGVNSNLVLFRLVWNSLSRAILLEDLEGFSSLCHDYYCVVSVSDDYFEDYNRTHQTTALLDLFWLGPMDGDGDGTASKYVDPNSGTVFEVRKLYQMDEPSLEELHHQFDQLSL